MNAFKRFFALILSLCMVLSFVPVSAFAAETGDEGSVTLTGTPTTPAGVSGNTEPFPLSVFTTFDDGDDSKTGHFRIPVMVTLKDDTVVAAADVRWHNYNPTPDDNGNIDTIVSRSTDNGENWTYSFANYFGGTNPYGENYGAPTYIDPGLGTDGEKLYMIVDLYPGQNGDKQCSTYSSSNTGYDQGRMLLCANSTVAGNQSDIDAGYYLEKYDDGSGKTLYKIYNTNGDEQTGYIVDAWFNLYENGAFTRNLFEYSADSFAPVFTSHLYLTSSSDGGVTWSEPTMINPSVRPGVGENAYLVNPGRGVYTKDGVLVFGGYRYPNQYANLMFSTDGGETWNKTALTTEHVSEHEIVELSDGTLRMFARHAEDGTNNLKYIDWVPVKTNGVVTDYTAQPAQFVDVSAYCNCNLSAIGYSRTYNGHQVIIVSCPTGGSRNNGKLYAFYVDDNKEMVKIGEKSVTTGAFSYSSLTELADGTVGLLYENGDSGNISYANYSITDIITDVTLDEDQDIFVFGADNKAGEVKVKKTAGVTHIHTQPNTNVSGVDGAYVAYDVVLCTDKESDCTDAFDCANVYTGEATVTIPINDALAAEDLKGFVVGENGLEYVMDVTVNTIDGVKLATFKAPHFSTVGVTAKTPEESASVQKNVTVKVGGTYVDTLTGVNLTGSNDGMDSAETAQVTWSSAEVEVTYPTAIQGDSNGFGGEAAIDLTACLYTFEETATEDVYIISATDSDGNTIYLKPYNVANTNAHNTNVEIEVTVGDGVNTNTVKLDSADPDSSNKRGGLHFHAEATNPYWNQCGSDSTYKHDILLYRPVVDGETASAEIPGFIQIAGRSAIEDGGQYLIVAKSDAGTYYIMYPTTSTSNTRSQIAEVTGETATRSEYETEVVIEGVTEGTTAVLVGDTLYNITVKGELNAVNVELKIGETEKDTLEGVNLTGSNAGKDSASIANVSWVGVSSVDCTLINADNNGTEVTLSECEFTVTVTGTSGNNVSGNATITDRDNATWYLDPNSRGYWNALCNLQFQFNDDGSVYVYKVDNYNYLYVNRSTLVWDRTGNLNTTGAEHSKFFFYAPVTDAAESSTELPGYKKVTSASDLATGKYLIAFTDNNGNLYVMNAIIRGTEAGKQMAKVQVANNTGVTITGVAYGKTSVVVGDTQYNITVNPLEKDVTLYPNQVMTYTDNTGNYQNKVGDGLDESIATMTISGGINEGNAVAAITEGKYVIFTYLNAYLTNDADGNYIDLNATKQTVWNVKVADSTAGTYYVTDSNGKYLFVNNGTAGVTETRTAVKLVYGTSTDGPGETGFFIQDAAGSYKLNNSGGRDNAYGKSGAEGSWSRWQFKPATEFTDVTFTGKAPGETSVVVGNTKYNIHVNDYETVNVVLKVNGSKTYEVVGVAYDDSDVTIQDDTVASVTTSSYEQTIYTKGVEITAQANLVVGKTYVIKNNKGGHNLTNENNGNNLILSGSLDDIEENAVWTLEAYDAATGVAKLRDANGKYLTIGIGTAGLSDSVNEIKLVYNTNGYWNITEDGHALNNANGSNDEAQGWESCNQLYHEYCQWSVYEVSSQDGSTVTEITIQGLKVGETTAKVGHITYNITVADDVRTVDIFVGETWKDTITGVNATGSNAGEASESIADVTWKGITMYNATANVMDTSGTVDGTVNLADAEMTFTNTDGKYTITFGDSGYLNIDGYPFHVATDDNPASNTAITLIFGDDGAVRLMNDAGHYLRIYHDSGSLSWSHRTANTGTITSDEYAFYIYAPVTDSDESSSEVPGYKRITAAEQIVSGQSYLLAFVKDNTYYVAYYNGDTGTNAFDNMARISTTPAGNKTNVTVVGKTPGNTVVNIEGVAYDITVKPYEKFFAIEVESTASFTPAVDVTQEAIDAFNAANGTYVTVALENGKLVFTGVAEGVVNEYLLGGTLYSIKVTRDVVDGDESKYVGGQSGTQGEGQVITGLIISNNTSYDLNMAADVVGEITWESSNEKVFTIDGNGNVTAGSSAGEAYVNVYVDGNLYQTIPVVVIETVKADGNNRVVDVYNTEVLNCTAYYTYNKEDIAIFPEGYQFYAVHSKAETDLITFYATPNEGYALTYMNGQGGTWFHTVTNADGNGYTVDGAHSDSVQMHQGNNNGGYYSLHDQLIAYVVNNSHAADVDTVHKMLEQAVLLEVDGAFFFSRAASDSHLTTSTFFVAEKLPEVDKAVNGILGVSGLKVDWDLYQEGMYAEVGELVYFTITIEMDEPIYWLRALNDDDKIYKPAEGSDVLVDSEGYAVKVDDNGNPYALLQYTNAELEDFMDGAYFYTKEQDEDDDVDGDGIYYEGFLAESEQQTVQDVTAAMNATWTEEERAANKRVLEYFVVYEIQPDDVNSDVENTVHLEYTYSSAYSNGSATSAGEAEASLKVLGNSLGDLLIDFGLPIEMTGLTAKELPGITADNMATFQANTNNAQGGCQYGTVTFRQETDGTYTLIYTPNEVMNGYDVIYIMDANNNLVNYVRVRPATTVYYEESFAALGNATENKTPGWTETTPVTGTQEYQHANCDCDDHNNFGYDGKYAAETRKSNGTEVASSESGDTATFTFTGTGFDLYANCDPASSVVAVMVYRLTNNSDGTVSEKLTKYYQVATKTKVGETSATDYQAVDADGCAIVSVTDLAHGTYKVIVRHTKRTDGSDPAVFYMDGFRIYNTVENSDQYYPAEEQRVTFTELRDEVLYAAGVTADSSQTYQNGSNIVSDTANGATVAFLRNEDGNIAANVNDWLNNGPKNEIWMTKDDNLAFTLYAGDADTQAGAVAHAQIGLKAPTGYAKVTIYIYSGESETSEASKEYEITSATDMFYDLPTADNGMINGMIVTIVVEEGLLSVTKLKTNVYEGGVSTGVLMPMDDYQVASALNLIYGITDDGDDDNTTTNPDDGENTDPSNPDDGENTDPSNPDDGENTDPSDPDDGENTDPSDPTGDDLEDSYKDSYNNTVTRIFGENRFETAFKVADELKAVLGVEKFENIIVACGSNFADALSGTYLASVKNAPILLSYTEQYNELVLDYIAENLAEDGTVYILGGNSAVPYTMDLALIAEGVTYKRLAGANRFETNLLILAEAGVEKEEVLVCTGSNFADSLSASATGKPILLVYNESGELTLAQKLYLALLDDCTFTVIGGEKAVCPELEKAVAEYGETKRLAGADRFETSVEIAKTYFKNPEAVVLAYAANYPDGLCGGALAYAIEAPLVLTMTDYEADADLYVFDIKAEGGVVLGGSGLIADDSVVDIFDLEKPQEIIVK